LVPRHQLAERLVIPPPGQRDELGIGHTDCRQPIAEGGWVAGGEN
jgi:hypothetical protein